MELPKMLSFVILATVSTVLTSAICPEPIGIANGYIETSPPYNDSDIVTFRCENGFAMSGVPSQVCQSDGTWSGRPPSCNLIDNRDIINHSVNIPPNNPSFPEWAVILICVVVGVVLLLLLTVVGAFVCNSVRCCQRPRSSFVLPSRHNTTRVVPVRETSTPMDRPKLVNVVEEVMDSQMRSAKEVKGWMPHSKPVRSINTSTR